MIRQKKVASLTLCLCPRLSLRGARSGGDEGRDPFKGVKGKKMLEKLEVARSVSSSSSSRDTPTSPAPPSSPSEPDVELIPEEPIEFPTLYSTPTPTQLLEEARQREEQMRESLERYEEMMHWEREAWRRREAEMQAQIHQLMYQMQAYAALVSPTWYPIERGRRRRRDDDDDDDEDVSELLVDAILKRPERIIRETGCVISNTNFLFTKTNVCTMKFLLPGAVCRRVSREGDD